MNLTAERKLKFDRRLQGRRGFVTEAELEVELESLDDAADKVLGPDEDAKPTLKASPAGRPTPAAPAPDRGPAEPAGTFGTQSFGGDGSEDDA
jgi:hypothetical protein